MRESRLGTRETKHAGQAYSPRSHGAHGEEHINLRDRRDSAVNSLFGVLRLLRQATVALLLLLSLSLHAEIIDRILAVVGGELITLSDVNAALRFGLVVRVTDGDPIRSALDALINRQMELTEVNRYQPPEPPVQTVERRLSAVRARFSTEADFDRALAQSGLTIDQLRGRLRNDERIGSYLDQRFGAGLQVSDDDLVAYYRSHEGQFTRDGVLRPFRDVRDEVRASLINEKRQELIKDWLAGLRRRAEISDLYLARN
jgi:hypothetical protein